MLVFRTLTREVPGPRRGTNYWLARSITTGHVAGGSTEEVALERLFTGIRILLDAAVAEGQSAQEWLKGCAAAVPEEDPTGSVHRWVSILAPYRTGDQEVDWGVMRAEVRSDVLRCLREAMPELRCRFQVQSLSVFGSVARGEAADGSDVDVLVEFDGQVGLFHLARLRRHLAELLRRPVDLGTPASLRPRIRRAALAEAVRVA